MPLETDTFANIWKEKICSLQSTPCNKLLNRIKMKRAENFYFKLGAYSEPSQISNDGAFSQKCLT